MLSRGRREDGALWGVRDHPLGAGGWERGAAVLRTYLLGQHYRALLTYSTEQLAATVVRWQRWAQTDATLRRLIAYAEEQLGEQAASVRRQARPPTS